MYLVDLFYLVHVLKHSHLLLVFLCLSFRSKGAVLHLGLLEVYLFVMNSLLVEFMSLYRNRVSGVWLVTDHLHYGDSRNERAKTGIC